MSALEAMQYAAAFAGSLVGLLFSVLLLVRRLFVKPFQVWLADQIGRAVSEPVKRLADELVAVKAWQKHHARHHRN